MEQALRNTKESSKKHILDGFKNEQNAIDIIHECLAPIVELSNLYNQLSRKRKKLHEKSSTKSSENGETAELFIKKNTVIISILQDQINQLQSVSNTKKQRKFYFFLT